MPRATDRSVLRPNQGLFLGWPPLLVPKQGLQAGLNFRIRQGRLSNLNLGWSQLGSFTLNGPVVLIDRLTLPAGTEKVIIGTPSDLYEFDTSAETVAFLTPRYETGTAAASGTAVTGTGTTWSTNAAAGDEIAFGATGETDPDATWYEVDSVGGNTSITLTASAGTVVDGPYTLRRKFTGDIQDIWVSDVFINAAVDSTNVWYATNGVDDVVKWDGADDQVTALSGLGFTCKTLRVFNNVMVYGAVTQSGDNLSSTIIASDTGDPEDVSTGLASQNVVHSGQNEIVRMEPLGDNLVIYSRQGPVVLAQYVGDPLIWVFRTAAPNIGPLAGRLVADFGDHHKFLEADSMYNFDGVSLRQVDMHVWREVGRSRDAARDDQAFSHFDDENGDLIWSIPLVTDADPGLGTGTPATYAYSEHFLEDIRDDTRRPYSRRSFPFTCAGYYERQGTLTWDQLTDTWADLNFRWDDKFFFVSFPFVLVGDINGKVYTYATAQNDADGGALESFVRFGRRALFDGRVRGLITRLYAFVAPFAGQTLNSTLRVFDHASATSPAATQTDSYDLTLSEGDFFTNPFRRGRFYEVEFGTDGPGEPWELDGYDLDARGGGRR